MPGMAGSGTKKDNYRMLSAIVETSAGPFFFKGVGPAKTMAKNEAAFRKLVGSVKE